MWWPFQFSKYEHPLFCTTLQYSQNKMINPNLILALLLMPEVPRQSQRYVLPPRTCWREGVIGFTTIQFFFLCSKHFYNIQQCYWDEEWMTNIWLQSVALPAPWCCRVSLLRNLPQISSPVSVPDLLIVGGSWRHWNSQCRWHWLASHSAQLSPWSTAVWNNLH